MTRHALVAVPPQMPATLTLATGHAHSGASILEAWAAGKSAHTMRSYQTDLERFAAYLSRALNVTSTVPPLGSWRPPRLIVAEALDRLFAQSSPGAHEILLGFRAHLLSAGLAPASINRHLACLRSVSKLGRMLGCMSWYLEVPGVKAEKRRQTSGPTLDEVRNLLAAITGDEEAAARDRAIIITFVCLGLRVSELCGLNLEDCDLARGTVWVKGKGRRERELVPLPAGVVEALKAYLAVVGRTARLSAQRRYDTGRRESWGPLFQSRGQMGRHRDGRLESRSVLRIIRERGRAVGLHLWPHALRHTAITTAIEYGQRAGVGLDEVRYFSRHKNLATMLLYRDEHDRAGVQQRLADVVATTLLRS